MEEVFGPNKSMADLNHVVILVQYFFMVDGNQSLHYFLKTHLFYDFLVHQEYRFVRETLIYLLTPGEQYLGLTPAMSAIIAEYTRLTGWTDVLAWNVNTKNPDKVLEEKKRVSESPDVIKFMESLPERLKLQTSVEEPSTTSRQNQFARGLVRTDSSSGPLNRSGELVGGPYQKVAKPVSKYLEWLSGVLFGKNIRTSQPQPEEIAMIQNNGTLGNLKNIDMLPLEVFMPNAAGRRMSASKSLTKQPTSNFTQEGGWDGVNDEVANSLMSPDSKPRRASMFKRAGTTLNLHLQQTDQAEKEKKFQFTDKVKNTISKLKGVAKWSALSRYISMVVTRKKAVRSKSNLEEGSMLNPNEAGEESLEELEFLKLHTPGFSLQPSRLYPEKVETYNINVLQEVRIFKDNFELNMKRERYILGVFEILRSSIFFVLESLDKPLLISDPELENHSALSSPNKKPSLLFSKKFPSSAQKPEDAWNIRILRDQFFRNTKLYEECLLSFMVRIEYKALNNIDINSIYTSASILVKILKNM